MTDDEQLALKIKSAAMALSDLCAEATANGLSVEIHTHEYQLIQDCAKRVLVTATVSKPL